MPRTGAWAAAAGDPVLASRWLVDFTADGPVLQRQVATTADRSDWTSIGAPIAADSDSGGTADETGVLVPSGAAMATPSALAPWWRWRLDGVGGLASQVDTSGGTWALVAVLEAVFTTTDTGLAIGFCDGDPGSGLGHWSGLNKTAASHRIIRAAGNAAWSTATNTQATGLRFSSRLSSAGYNSGGVCTTVSSGNPVDAGIGTSFGSSTGTGFVVAGLRGGTVGADTAVLPTSIVLAVAELPL